MPGYELPSSELPGYEPGSEPARFGTSNELRPLLPHHTSVSEVVCMTKREHRSDHVPSEYRQGCSSTPSVAASQLANTASSARLGYSPAQLDASFPPKVVPEERRVVDLSTLTHPILRVVNVHVTVQHTSQTAELPQPSQGTLAALSCSLAAEFPFFLKKEMNTKFPNTMISCLLCTRGEAALRQHLIFVPEAE